MSEEFLNQLPVKDLFALMSLTMDELMSMHKEGEDVKLMTQKQKEIKLLQRVIVAKRAAETPGK